MLVLLTERLGDASELRHLAHYLGDAQSAIGPGPDPRHVHMHKTRAVVPPARAAKTSSARSTSTTIISSAEREALSSILRYDIALYRFARDVVRDHWPAFRLG